MNSQSIKTGNIPTILGYCFCLGFIDLICLNVEVQKFKELFLGSRTSSVNILEGTESKC
jgi:hypothetical protein